ncbi:type II secretion system inner membrane protein GspF [Parvularcula marina]|uniref:General secretion pathway protein F n=1 Tax=Parvularcula marina TaxID=2292771 RepID=A0A371R857_9PROT|nr:type II secretion system inner membrane protein GspF [Parvularcula marina]RFB01643.1 type II secretion system protein GspF [Parvularcula marina]
MTSFRYEAVDAAGRRKKGVVSAETQRRARREIQGKGLTPLSIKSVSERDKGEGAKRTPNPPQKDIISATRQLATLIDASTTVEEALSAVAAQMRGEALAEMLLSIRARIIEGWKLSDALGEYPKSFSPLYRGIVSAGEASGNLGPVLLRLADMQEKNRSMAMKALSALIYPAVVFIVAVLVIVALMNFVVPQIVGQFARADEDLPLITDIVIGTSNFIRDWGWLLLLVLVGSGIAFWQMRRRPVSRMKMDRMILSLPLIGGLARELDAARFARTLATLFSSGAPLLDSLRSAKRTVTNSWISDRLETTLTGVREGASLSTAIRRAEVFPPMMASMIAAGERSGRLPDLLERTAAQMEGSFETAVNVTLRLLEPLVIVILGGIVLLIVLAIMLPILQINTMAL